LQRRQFVGEEHFWQFGMRVEQSEHFDDELIA
jgi:hypothetical protein